MFKILPIFFSLFLFSLTYAEIDKTEYTFDEKYQKISDFNWQNNLDNPSIEDDDASAYIDLRGFPYVSYLADKDEAVQFEYWLTGTEDYITKYVLLVYLSEDENNDDRVTVYVDAYDRVGYVDGSDWVDVDPDKVLADQWEREQGANKEKIKNGAEPITGLEWYIEPTFNKDKGYIYQTLKFFKKDSVTYNTFIYVLGRYGFQFINLAFGEEEVKYIDEKFLNKILDSYNFQEGKSYRDFQEGDEKSSTSAADLVTSSEPELNIFISTEILCVDTINSVNKTELNEEYKLIIRSVASGFNLYDYYMNEGLVGNSSSDEELLNDVSNYCLVNPGDSLLLAIVKVLFGDN